MVGSPGKEVAMAQDLTNAQWAFIEPLLPKLPKRADGRGRPWRDSRAVLNGILWVLRTGAQWAELPSRYPPYQTCHRRFQQWRRAGVMDRLLEVLAKDLEQRGKDFQGDDAGGFGRDGAADDEDAVRRVVRASFVDAEIEIAVGVGLGRGADVVVGVVVDFEEAEVLGRVAERSRDVTCLFDGRKADNGKAVDGSGLGGFGDYR